MKDVSVPNASRLRYTVNAVRWIVFLIALEAIGATVSLSVELATGNRKLGAVAGLVVAGLALIAFFSISVACSGFGNFLEDVQRVKASIWVVACLAVGGGLRLAWVIVYPSPLRSDARTYFNLGQAFAQGVIWPHAYWPPGYSLFLSVFIRALGSAEWVVTVSSFLLFATAAVGVYTLSRLVANELTARISVLAVSIWPNLVMCTGIGAKELLLGAVLPFALAAYVVSLRTNRLRFGFASGLLFGCAALTQPGWLLMPIPLVCYEYVRNGRWRDLLARAALVGCAMAVVILPWAYRNYRVLGHWVLISSNGGNVLYRANNPLATGGFTQTGQVSLDGMDEIEASKKGYSLAIEWIRANPASFLTLGLRKQILLLGDDATGPYETLKRSLEIGGGRYTAAKALANAWWLSMWFVLGFGLLHNRDTFEHAPDLVLVLLPFVYVLCVHSIFESSSRHHVALIGLLAIIVAALLSSTVTNYAEVPGTRANSELSRISAHGASWIEQQRTAKLGNKIHWPKGPAAAMRWRPLL